MQKQENYYYYFYIFNLIRYRWDGYFLRRERFAKRFDQDDAETIDESEEISDGSRNNNSFIEEEKKEKDKIISVPPWKLSLPDEYASIKFYNNNSYCGRISRKMMEGDGTYIWGNGVQYKVSVNISIKLIYNVKKKFIFIISNVCMSDTYV